jgi:hypothetical protein
MIPTFCIAHRDPLIGGHLYDVIILTHQRHDYQSLASIVAHPVMLLMAPQAGLVTMCGYRKIITTIPDRSHVVLPIQTHLKTVKRSDVEPRKGFEFLVCSHDFYKIGKKHRNIKEQWNACHVPIDLEDGLNLAVEMSLMSQDERLALEAEPALIEGGCSMGVFPSRFLIETLSKTWPFYQEFVRRYSHRFRKYNPAQRRCVAFLSERIETHFILKELRQRYPDGLPNELFGCLTSSWDGPWKQGVM